MISLVIQQTEALIQRVSRLEYITETYHEYKKEKEDFVKYLNKKLKKDAEDRTNDSVCDDKQKEVPEGKGSDKGRDKAGKDKTSRKKREG